MNPLHIASVAFAALFLTAPSVALAEADGPDFWAVKRVPAGDTLNIRKASNAQSAILGVLNNGDKVRNMGCNESGKTRWCRIERADGLIGWVAGRYLGEASDQTPVPRSPQASLQLEGGPDFWRVEGVIPDNALTMRKFSDPGADIIGVLRNGERVRNLGCLVQDQVRWCMVEKSNDTAGWVRGSYLRED